MTEPRTIMLDRRTHWEVRRQGRIIGTVTRCADAGGYLYRNATGEHFGWNTNRRAAAELMVRWTLEHEG